MRRYDSSYLYRKEGKDLFIDISGQQYGLAGFNRFSKVTVSLVKLTNSSNILLDRCERFLLLLIPFSRAQVKRLFYISVDIPSRPNTLATVLEFFREQDIDILECRSVDRWAEEGGLAELIVSVGSNFEERLGKGDQRPIFKKGLFEHLERKGITIQQERLTVEKPLPDKIAQWLTEDSKEGVYFNVELEGEDLFSQTSLDKSKYAVRIPSADRELYDSISKCPDKNYVSLIFDDQSNLLQAIFKDPGEVIADFYGAFLNRPGQLEKLAGPLGRLSVDLRLINPAIPDQGFTAGQVPYSIVANLQHTKFSLFNRATILKIARAEADLAARDRIKPLIELPEFRMNENNLQRIGLEILDCSIVECMSMDMAKITLGNKASWILSPQDGISSGMDSDLFNIRFVKDWTGNSEIIFLHVAVELPHSLPALQLDRRYDSMKMRRFSFECVRALLRDTFEDLLPAARERGVQFESELFKNQFLTSISDALYGAFLAVRGCGLVDVVLHVVQSLDPRIKETADLPLCYQDLKHGLIPFVSERRKIYEISDSGGEIRFKSRQVEQSDIQLLEKVEEFVRQLVEKVNGGGQPVEGEIQELRAGVAELRNLLQPKPSPTDDHDKWNQGYRQLREGR